MNPCSDHIKTNGLVYFARMLDKIRLKAADQLPDGYFTGLEPDRTVFDARCTRFLQVDYEQLRKRTLEGGTNEEILEWCFQNGRRPNQEDIEVWNGFILKRGWRDSGSEELAQTKKREGLGDRDDIQTFVDYHDVDEGRAPKRNFDD
jgi:gluconokinase